MMVESLTTVVFLAVIVEVVTNAIKSTFPFVKGGSEKKGSRITATVVGITLCITTNVGILNKVDIAINYNILDYVITGIIISRGANTVHDLISIFDKNRKSI